MKTLFSTELESGYKLSVQLSKEGPLGVRLENSKEEFVGQVFVSFTTIEDAIEKLSNYKYSISKEDLKSIKDQVVKLKAKSESTSKINSMLSLKELVNKELDKYLV